MNKIFSKFIEFFTHPDHKKDSSVFEKAKITVVIFLFCTISTSVYTVFYMLEGYLLNAKALLNYFGLILVFGGLFIIKKTGKINIALSFVSISSLFLITAVIYLTGGIHSKDLQWYTVLISTSFFFVSNRSGLIMYFLTLIFVSVFYFFEISGYFVFDKDMLSASVSYYYFNFILTCSMSVFLFYTLLKGNKKLQELIQKNKEQQLRVEIARDFHDQIGNKLASLQHLTELIKINKTEEGKGLILNRINDNAKEVYDNFRDFIWTLDTKSDSLVELFMYLRDFADDYFRFSDINIYTNSTPDNLPEIYLPGQISKELVPIFKEAITNIAKHSKAKNVHFNFEIINQTFTISLQDDGSGFDFENVKQGKGLVNMKHRASRTGGTLSMFSDKTSGTKIVFEVKLP